MTHQLSQSVNNQRLELALIEANTLASIFLKYERLKNYAHWEREKAESIVRELWLRAYNVEKNFPELEHVLQYQELLGLECVVSQVYEYSEEVLECMPIWERQRRVMLYRRCHPYKAAFYDAMVNWLQIPIFR